MPITHTITAATLATSNRFKWANNWRNTSPALTNSKKVIKPADSDISKNAKAINKGIKVPEVFKPTNTRNTTTTKAPKGNNKSVLNKACSETGKL